PCAEPRSVPVVGLRPHDASRPRHRRGSSRPARRRELKPAQNKRAGADLPLRKPVTGPGQAAAPGLRAAVARPIVPAQAAGDRASGPLARSLDCQPKETEMRLPPVNFTPAAIRYLALRAPVTSTLVSKPMAVARSGPKHRCRFVSSRSTLRTHRPGDWAVLWR